MYICIRFSCNADKGIQRSLLTHRWWKLWKALILWMDDGWKAQTKWWFFPYYNVSLHHSVIPFKLWAVKVASIIVISRRCKFPWVPWNVSPILKDLAMFITMWAIQMEIRDFSERVFPLVHWNISNSANGTNGVIIDHFIFIPSRFNLGHAGNV